MEEFVKTVREMRRFQKEYFRNRNFLSMQNSIRMEKMVDRMLEEMEADGKQLELNMEGKG